MSKSIFDIENEEEYLQNKENVDINEKNSSKQNALFDSSIEKTKWLIKHGIELNIIDDMYGSNALRTACEIKTQILIDAGLDIHKKNSRGDSLLFSENNVEKIKILLHYGVDINIVNIDGDNALTYAYYNEEDEEIEFTKKILLYINSGININHTDAKQENFLFSHYINTEIALALIDKGINIHQLNEDKENALFNYDLPPEVVEELIKRGVNIHQENDVSENALWYANEEVCELLLDAGININHRSECGANALLYSEMDETNYLIDKGIDLSIYTEEFFTNLKETFVYDFEDFEDYFPQEKIALIKARKESSELKKSLKPIGDVSLFNKKRI